MTIHLTLLIKTPKNIDKLKITEKILLRGSLATK